MATRIGIMAEIGLDGRGFQAGLQKAERSLQKFATGFATKLAGMFSAGAVINFGKQIINWVGEMKDFADSTGMTAEQVQVLNMAAKQTGVTLDDMTSMLKGLASARDTALGELSGTGKLGIFERLGFNKASILSMDESYESLSMVGAAIAKLPPGLARSQVAAELFGKSGAKAIAFLATNFDELRESLAGSGGLLSNEEFNRIDEYGDKLAALGEKLKAIGAKSAMDFLNPWERVLNFFSTDLTKAGGTFVGEIAKNMIPLQRLFEFAAKAGDAARANRGGGGAPINLAGLGGIMGLGLQAMMETLPIGIAEAYAEQAKKAAVLSFAPPTDELARIGGFIGGTGNSQVGILRNIERNTDKSARAGEQTVRKLENL